MLSWMTLVMALLYPVPQVEKPAGKLTQQDREFLEELFKTGLFDPKGAEGQRSFMEKAKTNPAVITGNGATSSSEPTALEEGQGSSLGSYQYQRNWKRPSMRDSIRHRNNGD